MKRIWAFVGRRDEIRTTYSFSEAEESLYGAFDANNVPEDVERLILGHVGVTPGGPAPHVADGEGDPFALWLFEKKWAAELAEKCAAKRRSIADKNNTLYQERKAAVKERTRKEREAREREDEIGGSSGAAATSESRIEQQNGAESSNTRAEGNGEAASSVAAGMA